MHVQALHNPLPPVSLCVCHTRLCFPSTATMWQYMHGRMLSSLDPNNPTVVPTHLDMCPAAPLGVTAGAGTAAGHAHATTCRLQTQHTTAQHSVVEVPTVCVLKTFNAPPSSYGVRTSCLPLPVTNTVWGKRCSTITLLPLKRPTKSHPPITPAEASSTSGTFNAHWMALQLVSRVMSAISSACVTVSWVEARTSTPWGTTTCRSIA